MKSKYYEALINKSPFGFALHRIMLNDYGQPIDYEFIDANPAYEELTGLKVNNIINRKVTDVLPEIKKDDFNWIEFYGKIALHGGEEVFEQYSESLKRWYKVQVYSPEENQFATVFVDITEQKLNEQRYQGLVESQNDLIVRVDANNRFTFVNKAYCETFGKSSNELLGSDFFPLIHEDDRKATAEAMEKLQVPPYRCYLEQRAMTVNGWRWLAWEDSAIRDKNGKIIEIQGVGRDITELKEKEEALQKQAASLHTLLSHTPAIIYVYKLKKGVPDIHYINENVKQVLGYSPDEFIHNFELWKSCIHPDDYALLSEKLGQKIDKIVPGSETYNEYRFKDKSGNYHWLSDRQKTIVNKEGEIEFTGAWVDITRDKEALEKLHNYQRRLSLAQNFAKAGSWEYDIDNETLVWSPECEALFGLDKGSFEGSFAAFLERVHPDDRDYVVQTNAPIVDLKEGISLDYEHRIVTAKGETRWVKESAGVVRDAEGKASHIIGLMMDITERKMAENAMENEKKLRDIVDNIEGIFWLRSADRFDMLYVSPAYEEIFGMSCESLYENPAAFVDAVHPEDSERIKKAYEKFMKTGVFKQEYRIIRPDGAMRWIATRAFPVKNDQGEVIRYAGISEDTTKRKLTEQSEREKTNNLNATIAALPDMLFFMSKDGTYLDVHAPDPEKLLAPKEAIIGRKIGEFFNENETAKQLQLYKECIEEQALKTHDYSIEIDGQSQYFEARLSPVDDQKLLAIVRDVTKEKIKEDELVFQTKLQKMLMEISKTYIDLKTDKLDEAINNSLCELGSFMQADRCYIFEHDYELKVTNNTYEWCADNIDPQIDQLKNVPFELFTEWLEAHQKGESFNIPDVLGLPEGHSLREILEPQGIKSLISVPIIEQGICTGFIGFDSVRKHHNYTETEEILLKVFIKLLVSVKNRMANERSLTESEIKFETVFKTSPYGIILSRPDDGKLIEVNDIFLEITGYTRKEALGKTAMELNLWDNPSDRQEVFDVVAGKGKLLAKEITFRNKYGHKIIGLLSAQLITLSQEQVLLTSVNDISERKQAYELIRKNEERFQQITETSQVVIWETDTRGMLTYVSPMAKTIWGYEPEELVNKVNYFDLHPQQGRAEYKSKTLELLEKNNLFRDFTNPIQKPDGSIIWVVTNGLSVLDQDGKTVAFRGSDQDITEQKKLFTELVQAKEKAEESNHLKSAFLATISHELRTPLNHVLGFSSLIMDMSEEEETRQFATMINKSGTDFLAMIEDIFNLALVEQSSINTRMSTFRGTELYMEAKSNLHEILHHAGKNDHIKLEFRPEPALLTAFITSDRQKINQVLTNLFKNAVKFTQRGSIEFGFFAEQDAQITFYVKDTGIGIAEDQKEVIFEFFRQLEDAQTRMHDGLGIGLAISARIAEALGAKFRIESEPGVGSCFYFTVPVSVSGQSTHEQHAAKDDELDLHDSTLLIVEDDESSRMLIANLLKKTNARILLAENGKKALLMLEQHPDTKLVLMDLKMPVMDGYEATKIIKAQNPNLPVIALTAYALASEKPKAFEAGCDAIVTKPVNKQALLKELKRFIS